VTGQERWRYQSGDSARFSRPAVLGGVVFFGSYDRNLHAVDALTGEGIWRFATEDFIAASPAVSGGEVYIGGGDGFLYAVSADTGRELWRLKVGGEVHSSSDVEEGVIYLGTGDGYVHAIDLNTREERWKFGTRATSETLLHNAVHTSYVLQDSVLSFGSHDGYVYAVDVDTGEKIWAVKAGEAFNSSPAIANGLVFYVDIEENLIGVDIETGQQRLVVSPAAPVGFGQD
jgi:outer membrane protein assembly factor BamB